MFRRCFVLRIGCTVSLRGTKYSIESCRKHKPILHPNPILAETQKNRLPGCQGRGVTAPMRMLPMKYHAKLPTLLLWVLGAAWVFASEDLMSRLSSAPLSLLCSGDGPILTSSAASGTLSVSGAVPASCTWTIGASAANTSLKDVSNDGDPGFTHLSIFGARKLNN